jgi:glycosyltransferase involved in cell wall biosynthesis
MAKIIVIASFPDSLITFRGNLLREMVENGHKVIACAPEPSGQIRHQIKELGVEFQEIPFDRAGLNPMRDIQSFRSLIGMLKRNRPDVVLAYTIKPVIYGSICATIAKTPVMASMITGLGYAFSGDTLKRELVNILVRFLYRFGIRDNKVVFFQNPDDLKLFRSLGLIKDRNRPVLINGSGVDLNLFSPKPFPSKTTFLLIARLIKEKGIREYVEAARIIKGKYPKVRFRLVGMLDENPTSITKEELDNWVKEGIVEYLGSLNDVRPAIADSSVYVLPSFYREGTPRTVLEAMAMGRPVITTDAPGCRETVTEGVNGFLVPIKNVPALVETMEKFIVQPSLIPEMGLASRQKAVDKYDVKKVNQIILENLKLLKEKSD